LDHPSLGPLGAAGRGAGRAGQRGCGPALAPGELKRGGAPKKSGVMPMVWALRTFYAKNRRADADNIAGCSTCWPTIGLPFTRRPVVLSRSSRTTSSPLPDEAGMVSGNLGTSRVISLSGSRPRVSTSPVIGKPLQPGGPHGQLLKLFATQAFGPKSRSKAEWLAHKQGTPRKI